MSLFFLFRFSSTNCSSCGTRWLSWRGIYLCPECDAPVVDGDDPFDPETRTYEYDPSRYLCRLKECSHR